MVAASIYTAARHCNLPRTLDEITETARITKKELGRTHRLLVRELKIKLLPTSPADYVPRFASELGLPGEVESRAIEILNECDQVDVMSGKGPTGVAAAALYVAAYLLNYKKTQHEVASVAKITDVTLRNRYKDITRSLDIQLRN